jgi:hypothetical protein
MTRAQVAWIRAEHQRLRAQYYDRIQADVVTDYDRGAAWGDLSSLVRLMQAFGIPIDPKAISPAEEGWRREAVKAGLG